MFHQPSRCRISIQMGVLLGAFCAMFVAPAQDIGGFVLVTEAMPQYDGCIPEPPVVPPEGAGPVTYDIFDNFWVLAPATEKNMRRIMVLSWQKKGAWVHDTLSGISEGDWQFIQADEFGFVWVASATQLLRLDPRYPEEGASDFTVDSAFPLGRITALGLAPSGGVLAALDNGRLVEADRTYKQEGRVRVPNNRITIHEAPAGIQELVTDGEGRVWVLAEGKVYRKAAPPGAWQRHWRLVGRIPGGNHNLSGDVMDGKFYMAGGSTGGLGYPVRGHIADELYEFDPETGRWRVAAKLGFGRVYNATSWLGGKVWVISGDVVPENGERHTVTTTQICDPKTGVVTRGPDVAIARPMPVAMHINGRIYVAGNPRDKYQEPGKLESIGPGETSWRREPDGPTGMGPLAATALDGKFYISVPDKYLAVFDTKTGAWATIDVPHAPRSCQMAACRGEVWLMGGRGVPEGREVQIYDPKTDTWRTGPPLPREIVWGAGTTVQGQLLVVGGAAGRCFNNRTFALRQSATPSGEQETAWDNEK